MAGTVPTHGSAGPRCRIRFDGDFEQSRVVVTGTPRGSREQAQSTLPLYRAVVLEELAEDGLLPVACRKDWV